VSAARRRPTAWAVPLLLFLAVLLTAGLAFNLANLDTGGESVPTVPDAGGTAPSSRSLIGLLPLIQAIVALGSILVLGYIVYVVLTRDREKRPRRARGRRTSYFQFFVFFLMLLVFLAVWRGAGPPDAGNSTAEDEPAPGGDGFGIPDLPSVGGIPLTVFLAASLLSGFVALAYMFRGARAPRTRLPPLPVHGPERAAAAEAVHVAIAEIEEGGDVRAAILACFRRFCDLLGARGVSGQAVLTPREIEGLAVSHLRVPPADAGDLTSLFEEARYSAHRLGEPARDRASASLERIRRALEA